MQFVSQKPSLAAGLGGYASASLGDFLNNVSLGTPGDPGSVQCPAHLIKAVPGNGCTDQTGFIDSGNYNWVADNAVNRNTSDVSGAAARFDWHLPAFALTALTAYEYSRAQRAEDSSGGPDYIFDFELDSATPARTTAAVRSRPMKSRCRARISAARSIAWNASPSPAWCLAIPRSVRPGRPADSWA